MIRTVICGGGVGVGGGGGGDADVEVLRQPPCVGGRHWRWGMLVGGDDLVVVGRLQVSLTVRARQREGGAGRPHGGHAHGQQAGLEAEAQQSCGGEADLPGQLRTSHFTC